MYILAPLSHQFLGNFLRLFTVVCAALLIASCRYISVPDPAMSQLDKDYIAKVPSFDLSLQYERYIIDSPYNEPEGAIIIETKTRFLYLILKDKKALRYGVAVGDEAFGWTGESRIARKAEWPNWTPPAEMVKRWPHVRPTKGGPDNPLGARALYLYDAKGRDTLYRIHGTNEPEKIGHAASSGCIRMRNIDVIDLYHRAAVGARVIVR
jgi:lipoprotein-anchoring transpeptidase ErfK/SrfK